MSNLQQNQPEGFNRVGQTGQTMQGQLPMQGQQSLISGQQPMQGQESLISGSRILGKEPIIETRPNIVGTQPIVETRNVQVGTQPIVEHRPIVVGQQPVYQPKQFVVGQQPIVQEQPAIVGERVLIEQYTQQPIFDPRLHLHTQNVDTSHAVGLFRHGARIALRSNKSRYLGFKGSRLKHSKRRKDTGVWLVESRGQNIFALKNAISGRYLSCDGRKLDFNDTLGEQELWRVEQVEHEGIGQYLLSNYKGDYLSEGFLGLKLRDTSNPRTFWEAEQV